MAFKYPECEFCTFHDVEPGVCEECEDGSEYEPEPEEDSSLAAKADKWARMKVAA